MFANSVSKRFYFFLKTQIDAKLLTPKELTVAMGLSPTNSRVFISRLLKGKTVKVEEILIAQQRYGLDPSILFDQNEPESLESKPENISYCLSRSKTSLISKIGKNLQELMLEKNISVEDLSLKSTISITLIRKIIDGRVDVPAYALFKIAEVLNVKLEYFKTGILSSVTKSFELLDNNLNEERPLGYAKTSVDELISIVKTQEETIRSQQETIERFMKGKIDCKERN